MTKEEKELKKKQTKNIKLYYIYKAFSWDLLFYYAISFLFLNQYKGLSASQIIFADAFYPLFKILFQLPSTIIVDKFGKRAAMIVGNMSLATYVLFVFGCNSKEILIIANIFMAIGFVLKSLSESNIIYDSIPKNTKKQKAFSKIDGRSSAIYYVFEALSCALSGYLYTINPNIPMAICLVCTIISVIISHLFSEVPEDIDNPDEDHEEYKNSFVTLKSYIKNLRSAFKFIFSSGRLKSLIYFNAVFISIIYLLITYRRSLLVEVGLDARYIGIIFAFLGILSAIGSALTHKINKLLKNKTLTYLGLYFSFSIMLSGIIALLHLPSSALISLIILMLGIQFLIKGPYYTLIRQYLSSFATSNMRVKILTASNLIEGLVTSAVAFFGSWLLTFTSTAYASIIIGAASFVVLIILLEFMSTRVGLQPDEYKPSEINFKEVE